MKYYPDSRVEIEGIEAKLYDRGLDFLTLGIYPFFIRDVIRKMNIEPHDRILDMGAGTGRNACLMRRYLSDRGEIVGLDIGEDMINIFKRRCGRYSNVKILKMRIDRPLPFKDEFDKVFISFVIHGFPHEVREVILDNAFRSLKKGGSIFILDYNRFDVESMPFPFKQIFKRIECKYAFDFIRRDFTSVLREHGFKYISKHTYFRNYLMLLKGGKDG